MSEDARFWFRILDDEPLLMDLKPSELKVFLVILRDIQRARNTGRISSRQVADRSGISLRHAHAAIQELITKGLIECTTRIGATAVYRLPYKWRDRSPRGEHLPQSECSPTGEQLDNDKHGVSTTGARREHQQGEHSGKQLGEQFCSPTGERQCSPTGEQHLESSESSDAKDSRQPTDGSRTFRKNREKMQERAGLPSPIPNGIKTSDGLTPAGAIESNIPAIEDLQALKYEMAEIRGVRPASAAMVAVLEALGDVPLRGFIEHLKAVHPRYRPGGHRAVTTWKWFESTAKSYAEGQAQAQQRVVAGACRHGRADGSCSVCPPRAGLDAALEAF